MALSPEQYPALKTAIDADPALAALPNTPDDAFAIADAFNAPASPAFVVWRSRVEAEEVMSNGFVWTAVDSLTVGKARIWDWMTRYGSFNPSKTNIRQGLADCFGGASAMVAGILPHCKEPATRAEKLYATGTGTDAVPATRSFEGAVTYQDVFAARNLP
jgi:hypothetical protein